MRSVKTKTISTARYYESVTQIQNGVNNSVKNKMFGTFDISAIFFWGGGGGYY